MRDLPAIWAMSVPMANAMGNPRMFNPGVTIQAPPMPKKPPMHPTENPMSTIPGHHIVTPAMGIYIYVQLQSIWVTSLYFLFQDLVLDELSGCKVETCTSHYLVCYESESAA